MSSTHINYTKICAKRGFDKLIVYTDASAFRYYPFCRILLIFCKVDFIILKKLQSSALINYISPLFLIYFLSLTMNL